MSKIIALITTDLRAWLLLAVAGGLVLIAGAFTMALMWEAR